MSQERHILECYSHLNKKECEIDITHMDGDELFKLWEIQEMMGRNIFHIKVQSNPFPSPETG